MAASGHACEGIHRYVKCRPRSAFLQSACNAGLSGARCSVQDYRDRGHLCGLTFELSGRRRQDARPGQAKMYTVLPARAWWPAVGAPLERGVRPHCARCDEWSAFWGHATRLPRLGWCGSRGGTPPLRGTVRREHLAQRVAGHHDDAHHVSAAAVPWWSRSCQATSVLSQMDDRSV